MCVCDQRPPYCMMCIGCVCGVLWDMLLCAVKCIRQNIVCKSLSVLVWVYFLRNSWVKKVYYCKGHLVYSLGNFFMITLSSVPFKIIKFSLFKVIDPPYFLWWFNMADVKLSLRERLPTFQTSWDHVIPQHLCCGLRIPHLYSCGVAGRGNAGYISLAPANPRGLQFNFRWVQTRFRLSWFLWLLFLKFHKLN